MEKPRLPHSNRKPGPQAEARQYHLTLTHTHTHTEEQPLMKRLGDQRWTAVQQLYKQNKWETASTQEHNKQQIIKFEFIKRHLKNKGRLTVENKHKLYRLKKKKCSLNGWKLTMATENYGHMILVYRLQSIDKRGIDPKKKSMDG